MLHSPQPLPLRQGLFLPQSSLNPPRMRTFRTPYPQSHSTFASSFQRQGKTGAHVQPTPDKRQPLTQPTLTPKPQQYYGKNLRHQHQNQRQSRSVHLPADAHWHRRQRSPCQACRPSPHRSADEHPHPVG